jgi:HKD family nuclease
LCGYSISTIKPFKEYIEKLNAEKEGNIFNGTKQSAEEDFAEDDMSWLNDL